MTTARLPAKTSSPTSAIFSTSWTASELSMTSTIWAHAPYGTYDCTGSGTVKSWADIARAVFEAANGNGDKVVPVSTADYYANAEGPIAPRPVHSALDLSKLESVGFHMSDWEKELGEYVGSDGDSVAQSTMGIEAV